MSSWTPSSGMGWVGIAMIVGGIMLASRIGTFFVILAVAVGGYLYINDTTSTASSS